MRSHAKKYWVLKFLTLVAIVCIICFSTIAKDVNAPPAAPAGDVNVAPVAPPAGDVNKPPASSWEGPSRSEERAQFEQRMQKRISVDFRNTPIEDVIRIMSEQADIDVIKSPAVTGVVTVTLRNVPLEEALNNILAAHGYSYVMSENMIRVITTAEKTEKPELLQTRTYEIVYADVKEVVKALDKFKSKQGMVASIEGTSYIIVTDTESKIREITNFIEKIDRMTPQILVEVRIYDITSKENFDIGTDWYIGRNTPITEIAREKDVDNKTHTTTTDDITETTAGTWLKDFYGKSNPFTGGGFNKTDGGTLRFGVLNDAVDIDLSLSMLHKQISAKLLANPRILVLDNEKASIDIISEIPYQRLTESAMGGSMGTTEFKEVGVKLEVTPHLAARDEMIRLHLKPEFSVKTGEVIIITTGSGAGFPEPVVDRRTADTILLIKNGQTVVLGGLRKKETSQDIRKVPLLGDMPVFGNLFRSESESTVNSEIVVFITTWIIKQQPVMSQNEQGAYKETEFKGPKPSYTGAESSENKK